MVIACFAVSSVLALRVAPTESTMGDVQRILYLHVSVAWCGLGICLLMGICGAMFLASQRLEWDHWSQAAAEVGWLCTTLTLLTGSAWAHEAWGTWWTWDPRLTSSLILWTIYAGIIFARASIEDPYRRGRISGVLAIIGMSDLPVVIMATRWFRGVHPVTPEMDSTMRYVLLACALSFTAMFTYFVIQRQRQLGLFEKAARCEGEISWSRMSANS
jgi:heme exporter protein C